MKKTFRILVNKILSALFNQLKKLLNQKLSMIWVLPALLLSAAVFWGWMSSGIVLKSPREPLSANPKTFGYEFEPFQTKSSDNITINGWFVPCKKETSATLLILHGWGANRSDAVNSTIFLAKNYNLAYFDFRNHGTSGGRVTSLTCGEIKDLTAAVHFLQTNKKEQSRALGVFGFSMGGAVAISGAADLPSIQAVVAESPFSSFDETLYRYAKLFYKAPRWVTFLTVWFTKLRLGFDPEKCAPLRKIAQISPRPVFIIQGSGDARMPVSEGETLFKLAKEPKTLWTVPNADHGNVRETVPEEYEKRILEFFEKWIRN